MTYTSIRHNIRNSILFEVRLLSHNFQLRISLNLLPSSGLSPVAFVTVLLCLVLFRTDEIEIEIL